MFFTRIASVFCVVATFGALVLANPLSSFEKRQDTSSIEGIVSTLKSSTDSILPQISALGSGGNATSDGLNPLISELDTALNTAATSLTSLTTSTLMKRQSDSDIATLVACIVTDITNALASGTLLDDASTIPELGSLFAGIDASLNQVLVGLETLLAGVLNLVGDLLTDVAGLLSQLAFGLTLASLGL